jgi:rhodanese-related sulfurtransferase
VVAAQRQGAHVVDLRERTPYAARHLEGTTHVPYGTQCATYVGWLVPWGEPIVLLAEDEGTIQEALTDLARIGIERVEGTTVLCGGSVPECGPGYRRVRWEDLAGALREVRRLVVLDVRQRAEYDAGHLAGAISIPLQELRDQLPRLPVGDLWVHCQSGYRAAAAASLVHAAGRDVVLVDDDLGRAAEAGLSMAGLPGS